MAPTLFGLEEETIRHRNKQRVIMSLYDPAVETPARPEPAPKPAPAPAEAPAPAPVVETPASEVAAPVPAEVSAPEPEIAAGEPAAVPEVSAAAPEFRKPVFGTVPEPEEEGEDDEFYLEDLIGFAVEAEETGTPEKFKGTVSDYYDSDVNPLFELEIGGRQVLVPAAEEFIAHIDFEARTMHLVLPEGLLTLE